MIRHSRLFTEKSEVNIDPTGEWLLEARQVQSPNCDARPAGSEEQETVAVPSKGAATITPASSSIWSFR